MGTLYLMLVVHQLASLTLKTISAPAALCFRVHDLSDKKQCQSKNHLVLKEGSTGEVMRTCACIAELNISQTQVTVGYTDHKLTCVQIWK